MAAGHSGAAHPQHPDGQRQQSAQKQQKPLPPPPLLLLRKGGQQAVRRPPAGSAPRTPTWPGRARGPEPVPTDPPSPSPAGTTGRIAGGDRTHSPAPRGPHAESFRTSSFRARSWWRPAAHRCRRNRPYGYHRCRPAAGGPPPLPGAAASASADPPSADQASRSRPRTAPTRGNAHKTQARQSSDHRTQGMGRREYMEKAIETARRYLNSTPPSRSPAVRRPPLLPGRTALQPAGAGGPARPDRPPSRENRGPPLRTHRRSPPPGSGPGR